MIGYQELDGAEGELRELVERRQAISPMPVSLDRVDAFEELYWEAERLGVPHFMASARFEQYWTLSSGGLMAECVPYFLQLLQLFSRYGDLIHPDNVTAMRNSAPGFVSELMGLPEVPLATVRAILTQLERQIREQGAALSNVHLSNAMVAAGIGDTTEALAAYNRWHAEGDPAWSLGDDGNARVAVGLLEAIDLRLAIDLQVSLLQRLDLDEEGRLYHRTILASLLSQAGRADEAATHMAGIGSEEILLAEVPRHDALRALENDPEAVEAVVQIVLREGSLQLTDQYPLLAALARVRLRRDPDDGVGRDLMLVAERYAARLDERNGTGAHERALAERWWTGLPRAGAAVTDDEAGQLVEDAILAWLDGEIAEFDEVPFTLKERYLAITDLGKVLSAESHEEAEAVAAETRAEAARLRFPTGTAFADYSLCAFHHMDGGERRKGFSMFWALQRLLLERQGMISEHFLHVFVTTFATLFEQQLAAADIPLERLLQVLRDQADITAPTELPTYPLAMARATLYAHVGDTEGLHRMQRHLLSRAHDEDAPLGSAELQVVLTTIRSDAEAASRLLESLPDDVVEGQAQSFAVLRAYLARRAGRLDEAARLAESVFEEQERDVEEVDSTTSLAFFVSALDASSLIPELCDDIEAYVRRNAPQPWESLAALAGVLLRRDPADERGLRLLEETVEYAKELDARNATTAASDQLRLLWL